MATPIEILGVVGTWVAAVVAVIALISITGPILIFCASRTDRHRAITAVGDDNNGFVSRGYHAGPGIYLFRRVRSPMLQSTELFREGSLSWDVGALVDTNSPSTWVQLGCLIKAYGVKFGVGDALKIDHEQTLLPVHRLWILGVGVLGRYRFGKGKGKSRRVTISGRERSPPFSPDRIDVRFDDPSIYQPWLLHGITGTFRVYLPEADRSRKPALCLSFSRNTGDDIKDIPSESLSLGALFMLGKGFLPSSDGQYIDLNGCFQQDDEHSSGDSSPLPARNTRKVVRRRAPSMSPTDKQQAFELCRSVDLDEHSIKEIGFNIKIDAMLRLESVRMDRGTTTLFKEFVGMTYVPATSNWVRCSNIFDEGFGIGRKGDWYIRRKDAQQLAHALLKLAWHPESYLLGVQYSSICLELLFSASKCLFQVMQRMQPSLDKLGLGNDEVGRLDEVLRQALRRVEKLDLSNINSVLVTITRSTAHVFYKLDEVLEILCHQNDLSDKINCMIGVLMLTNEEFATLISESVRCLDDSTNSTAKLDMLTATLKVPSAFGFMQSFIVDLDVLYPNGVASAEVITIRYSTILLVSLKACLRSAMLRTCFGGCPLFDVFYHLEKVTNVY